MIEQTVPIHVTQIPDHIRDVLAEEMLAMILRWKASQKEKESKP